MPLFPLSASMRHHLRAALAVGAAVTVLHGLGLLGWLDALMLRLVAGAAPAPVHRAAPADGAALPQVLLIGPTLHETAFDQAAPLPAQPLATLLAALASPGLPPPATLVLDLDLSPGPRDDPGRAALDAALRQLVTGGTRVVLPLPARVATPALLQRKAQWLQSLCRLDAEAAARAGAGLLLLALPEVVTTQGVAAQFDPATPSLGLVALPGGEARSLCPWVLADGQGHRDGARWQAALLSSAFDNRALPVAVRGAVLRPFNARLFQAQAQQVTVLREVALAPALRARLAGATVFLGGAYQPQDSALTPFDGPQQRTEGVLLHAATHDSARQPVGVVEGLAALALDVALGVALGALFSLTWGWHQKRARTALHFPTAAAQAKARLSLLANLVLVAVLVLLALLLAQALFFPWNLWVNPGPVVLGVFAKFVLASRGGADHGAGHGADPGTHPPAPLARLDQAALLLLVAAALAVVLLHP